MMRMSPPLYTRALIIEDLRALTSSCSHASFYALITGSGDGNRTATRHYEAKEISNEVIFPHMVPLQRRTCLLPPS
jgi:hypothetical protein